MAIKVLFAAGAGRWDAYRGPLAEALREQGLDVVLTHETDAPGDVDYIVFSPGGVVEDFTPFSRCKAVLNLWAGVEKIVGNPTLTQPLCRMVDPAMTESMVEWVAGHVLRHHLGMDAHIHGLGGVWEKRELPPLARERPVAMLGLGALGRASAVALAGLGFPVMGWSRAAKSIDGIETTAGAAGIETVLRRAQIVVMLLPHTPETENLLDAERLGWLPRGAVVINPGRGALIDDDALLAALDTGRVGHATLDVFRIEPLPPAHPFWAHPRVTVTPHIASETRPVTAARVIAENIRRSEDGKPLLNRVDRARGY